MKTKKIIYISIIALFAIGAFSFGIIHKQIFKTNNSRPPLTPQQEILGVWILEDEPNNKVEFLSNGQMKLYIDNVLNDEYGYTISNFCDGNISQDERLFLRLYDGPGTAGTLSCDVINGINVDNSGVLSLMDDSGRIIVYRRQ